MIFVFYLSSWFALISCARSFVIHRNDPATIVTCCAGWPEEASVGDYVKGVHGGKYQFTDAGINIAGQDFAALGYSAAPPLEEHNEERPNWAARMGTDPAELQQKASEEITVPAQIVIRNQERTWEPFFVKVQQIDAEGNVREVTNEFEFTPCRGKLAPRGGATNPYDPSNPFLDNAKIEIRPLSSVASVESTGMFLVVGTEEEKWFYRLLGSRTETK